MTPDPWSWTETFSRTDQPSGPCRCEDCRTSLRPGEVPPTAVRDGLCGFCLKDGCAVTEPEGTAS